MNLTEKECKESIEPMKGEQLQQHLKELGNDWELKEEHHLQKEFQFDDFAQALDFVNKIGKLAEQQNHHPVIALTWGKVVVTIWTHKIDGLTENDFILAAKIDKEK